MADQDDVINPIINQVAVGVDESSQELEPGPEWEFIYGLFPVYHEVHEIRIPGQSSNQIPEQGVLQRLAGKKLIDANPNQKVFAIAQAFNGFGQFGYYVQTDQKLYFHTCEAPKDLHISFATLQSLGTDENGLSLDIFGHQPSSPTAVPDNQVSCVFEFPLGDQPTPPNAAHPGVDYLVITLTPQTTTDSRMCARLVALDTGTGYDNKDVGFYLTQSACRFDSVPLVAGVDGEYGLPPSTSRTAFLGWGGSIWKNIWTATSGPRNAVWSQVGAPSRGYPYANAIGVHWGVWQGGYDPSNRPMIPPNVGNALVYVETPPTGTTNHYWRSSGQAVYSGTGTILGYIANQEDFRWPAISFPNGAVPAASNSGRYALQGGGTTIIQDFTAYDQTSPSWQQPFNISYAITWTWADGFARTNQATTSSDVNKTGYERSSNTYWRLTSAATTVTVSFTYPDITTRQNASGFISSDVGKIAHQTDNDTYWVLSDYNRHSINTNLAETFFVNLNRLFTDYQSITPVSLSFMIRVYWDKVHGGSGNILINVKSYKGGLLVRSDGVMWGMDANATLVNQQTTTKAATLLAVNSDIVGLNLVQITVQMADGIVNLTTPAANGDAATPCPF